MTDGYAAWRMPKGIKHLGCMAHARPNKDAVLRNVRRLLKLGAEFFFSDVYADRRVPKTVRGDAVLCGECLGGALYWNDFLRLAHRHQFADPRLVTYRPLAITDPVLTPRMGNLRFFSATYRLFKIEALETACEGYRQAVVYRGTIADAPDERGFSLRNDRHRHRYGRRRIAVRAASRRDDEQTSRGLATCRRRGGQLHHRRTRHERKRIWLAGADQRTFRWGQSPASVQVPVR